MANIFEINRVSNKITLGTTNTTINIASHTASRLLALDTSKDLEVVTIGSSLDYTRPTLNTIQDIRTSASPTFVGLNIVTNAATILFNWTTTGSFGECAFKEGSTFMGYIGCYGSTYGDTQSNNLILTSAVNNDGAIFLRTRTGGNFYDRVKIANNGNVGINTATPDTKLQVVGDCKFGDDNTNYIGIGTTGDISFTGSAGFYLRFLTQSAEPAAGTGATQCDTSETVIWKDSDDSKIYLCFNDGGTVKTVELI